MPYRLFYADGSAAMGVRVILEEVGETYELIETEIGAGMPRAPELLAVNALTGTETRLSFRNPFQLVRGAMASSPEVYMPKGKTFHATKVARTQIVLGIRSPLWPEISGKEDRENPSPRHVAAFSSGEAGGFRAGCTGCN